MAIPKPEATIKFFGQDPTTIVMRSSTSFDGTAQTGTPDITPGKYVFPVQAGGGLYNFHEGPIEVLNVFYSGGGTLTIKKRIVGGANPGPGDLDVDVDTISGSGDLAVLKMALSKGEYLVFTSSASTNPIVSITAKESGNRYGAGTP